MKKIGQIVAISKYIKFSPKKVQKYLKLLKGKSYTEALQFLLVFKQKILVNIFKLLYSAAANAYQNFSIQKENLIISEAFVTRSSIFKRTHPRARGKAYKIEKIFSHITIKLKENNTI